MTQSTQENVLATYVTLVPRRRERRRTSELTDILGITLGNQSTLSIRKGANAHWHAIIATAVLRYSVNI